jgi:glucose-6-phosphate dehydrogenase assembly protein OpcA
VERDLAALWESEAAVGEGEAGRSVARACRATLVAPVAGDDQMQELVDDVARLHPSRVILVETDPSSTRAHAWVSATCSRYASGASLVCCETVHLEAPPDADRAIAAGVRALAVGGVPLVALSEHVSPLGVGWVRELASDLDLVLGNASHLGIADGLALWDRCLAPDVAKPPFRDLLWTELGDWRRAVASRFDGVRARRLESIRSVTVTVAEGPGGRLKAWLFLGWLASRLGWRIPGGPIAVRVVGMSAPAEGSTLLAVTMDFAEPPVAGARSACAPVSVCWRRLPTEGAILVEEGGAPVARLNQTKTSRASAVVEEIRRREMPRAAGESMETARRWGALEASR